MKDGAYQPFSDQHRLVAQAMGAGEHIERRLLKDHGQSSVWLSATQQKRMLAGVLPKTDCRWQSRPLISRRIHINKDQDLFLVFHLYGFFTGR
jgi:hypothetical protein